MDEYLTRLAPFVVALCAGAAAWLLVTAAPSRGRRVRAVLEGGRPDRAKRCRRRWRVRPRPPAEGTARVLLWCLTAGGLLSLWGRSVLPLIAAGLAAPVVLRWWRRRQERREADRRREAVIDFCRSVAAEVRAGRQPSQALAATGVSGFGGAGAAILAAARYGGDVPRALGAAADRPGAEGLRGVAACWRVAVDSGASLALGLEKVARALRAERDQQEELRAHLAGPRATAVLLAALPLFGLLLGAVMGVEPLRVLLHSTAGLGCLLIGVLLELAGLAWVTAITRSAEKAATR